MVRSNFLEAQWLAHVSCCDAVVVYVFVDGFSGMLSTVQPVINTHSEASEIQSLFLVLSCLLPFHCGFLPLCLPMFDGVYQ